MLRLPIPIHLRELFVMTCEDHNEFSVVGHIECPCGNKEMEVLYVGEQTGDGSVLNTFESDANHGNMHTNLMQLSTRCMACKAEHQIFDNRKHGWYNYLHPSQRFEDTQPYLKTRSCPKCHELTHWVELEIYNQGINDFRLSSADKPEEEWTEAFEYIIVNLQCCHCGHADEHWIDIECN